MFFADEGILASDKALITITDNLENDSLKKLKLGSVVYSTDDKTLYVIKQRFYFNERDFKKIFTINQDGTVDGDFEVEGNVIAKNINETSVIITQEDKDDWDRKTKTFVYQQLDASDTWDIVHNLGKKPSVTVVNSANDEVWGDINYISDNELIINFIGGFKGQAYLN